MTDSKTAMFLLSARSKTSGFSVGVTGASEALKKVRELEADGFHVTILDAAGRERSIAEIEITAISDKPRS